MTPWRLRILLQFYAALLVLWLTIGICQLLGVR